MRKLLVLGALTACGRPDVRPPAVDPPPPKWHLACEGDEPRDEHVKLELSPIKLHASRWGPRAIHRSRAGHARAWPQLEAAMAQLEPVLRGCWRWASSRNAPEVSATLSFTATPFGRLEAFSIATSNGRAPELAACLQEALGNVAIADVSPRTTRMHARLAFVREENEEPWIVPPQRPDRPLPIRHPRVCIPVLDGAEPDVLASPVVYTVDDLGPRDGARELPFEACSRGPRLPNDDVLLGAYEANRGEFEACYADALAHNLDAQVRSQRQGDAFSGIVELRVVLAGIAEPRVLDVNGPGSAAFHACLREAAKGMWLADRPIDVSIDARLRFELQPVTATTEPVDVAKHERALANARGALARCQARAELLLALAAERPWLDDARLLAQTRTFTREAAALPHPEQCIEARVETLLDQIAGGLRFDDNEFRWSLLERVEAVLPIADHVDWGFMLRWYHAATIAMTPERNAEGIAILRALARSDDFAGSLAERELSRYALPHTVRPTLGCD